MAVMHSARWRRRLMAKNPFPFVRQWRPYLQNGVELNSDLPYPDTRREKTAEAQTESKFLLVDVLCRTRAEKS